MRQTWGEWKLNIDFLCESLKERISVEDLGIKGKIILKLNIDP
jgi:hypothetical protein